MGRFSSLAMTSSRSPGEGPREETGAHVRGLANCSQDHYEEFCLPSKQVSLPYLAWSRARGKAN